MSVIEHSHSEPPAPEIARYKDEDELDYGWQSLTGECPGYDPYNSVFRPRWVARTALQARETYEIAP